MRPAWLWKRVALVLWGLLAAGRAGADAAPAPVVASGVEEVVARREYEATRNARGLQAPNRAHGLRTYFAPDGIRVHDRTAAGSPELLGLALSGVGRGGALAPVEPGEVVHDGARVEIRRPGLVEWYVNSDAGLEQGFTLDARPDGAGALAFELAVSGARASLRAEAVTLATGAGRKLAYGKLAVRDATGRALAAHMEVPAADRIRLVVADAGAVYPVVVDPLLTQSVDGQIESNQVGAQLGYHVAGAGDVNGDGFADVIIGAYLYDLGETDEGAVFVFHGSAAGITATSPASAQSTIQSNVAGMQLGTRVASAGDVNGDGYSDVLIGSPNYTNGEVEEGAFFIFHGGGGGIPSTDVGNAATRIESDQAGTHLGGWGGASAGDVNGDGYADVIVGSSNYTTNVADWPDAGAAFVFHGSASGIANGSPVTAAARLTATQGAAAFGSYTASAGDVNGDGYADVIVGAPFYDEGHSNEGAAFVFLGDALGIGDGGPGTADTRFESNQAGAEMGFSLAPAGDVNGDGYADVIIGAVAYDTGQGLGEGSAFVFHGGASGIPNGNPTTAATRIDADQANANLGHGVSGAGDVNGDGYADVIVGVYQYDAPSLDEGVALVYLGGPDGVANGNPDTAFAKLEQDQASGAMGFSVAAAGDVNGDGYADVIVGSHTFDSGSGFAEGAAFVYHGGAQGVVDATGANAAAQLESDQAVANLGWSVAGAGDVNGDGYSDVIVGAPNFDAGQSNEGAAFVFLGSAAGIQSGSGVRLESDQADAELGWSVAGAGDVNGDGYADVIVGARYYDAGQSDEGAAFVFLGGASGIAAGNPTTAAAQLESDQAGGRLGEDVAGAGDVNGDGYGDVIVGAELYDVLFDGGAAFVFHGGPAGIADGNPATADTFLESSIGSAAFGSRVAGAGDVNGDGYADVLVGSAGYDTPEADEGGAFVFYGGASGIADGASANAAVHIESDQAFAYLGVSVAGAGDVNGDGYGDILVGAWGYDDGESEEGAAFLFLGGASLPANRNLSNADASFYSDETLALLGGSVDGAGDVNGDGYADIILGAYHYNDIPSGGAAFVFHGSAAGIPSGTPATAAATLTSGQVGAYFGHSVAGAGDVNGDGYADVIAGAWRFDGGESLEGAAFVFHGNGDGDGRPVLARQLAPGAGDGLIQPWGRAASVTGNEFRVRMQATHPQGRGRVKLQFQACATGDPLGGVSCLTHTGASWTDVTASSAGVTLTGAIPGLENDLLKRWRARVLYAPFSVTQPGITAPAGPAHSPWRRLQAQAFEGDIRVVTDTDGDGIRNHEDPDDDGDGLSDADETGVYGTNPLDPDSDDDALDDGAEIALGTDPLDPDTDDDARCDGPTNVSAICTSGDNCPFIDNNGQENGDAYTAGDACQCGDTTGDGTLTGIDYTRAREHVAGRTLSGAFQLDRCDVTGDSACDVADLALLDRLTSGSPADLVYGCEAYTGP